MLRFIIRKVSLCHDSGGHGNGLISNFSTIDNDIILLEKALLNTKGYIEVRLEGVEILKQTEE